MSHTLLSVRQLTGSPELQIPMFSSTPSFRRFVQLEESGLPVLQASESIDYTLRDVEFAFNPSHIEGTVTLFVTTARIIVSFQGKDAAYDFDPQYVILHAITRDPSSYNKPCLYCQLNNFDDFEVSEEEEDSDTDETASPASPRIESSSRKSKKNAVDHSLNPKEMYLAPAQENDLKELFEAFSHVALLNPDPAEDGEEEGDDELIYNIDEVNLGVDNLRKLVHLESVFKAPEEGQFDE